MPKEIKKNWLYWLGYAGAGLAGIAVSYSDMIIPEVFPEHTLVNKLAIPVSLGLKFLWDTWKYRNGNIAEHGKKMLDKLPNGITGKFNSK